MYFWHLLGIHLTIMTIKNKLRAGIGFLFLVALISWGLADYYLNRLSTDSKVVLKNNYRSLIYIKNMGQALDMLPADASDSIRLATIEKNLVLEEHNITEPGEAALAISFRNNFEHYKHLPPNTDSALLYKSKIKTALYGIMQLNMNAIEHKNNVASHTAERAIITVSLIGLFCFLIAFSFVVNFPGYIANPVNALIQNVQQLNEAKTTFISTVSHELKTPLSSIKMSLRLLEDSRIGKTNEEQQQLLKNIDDDTQRLLKITGELLDVAQVETGKIRLHFGSTHPKNIVNYALRSVKSLADQKLIAIKVTCPETLPNVMADLDKSTWVLINLLSNAIKYSPAQATIDLVVKKYDPRSLEFSVKDVGPGIESRYLSQIFQRYFKVPGADPDKTGTGLGLAIAKDFIEAQGGHIRVESEPGQGSTFYFTLVTNNA